MMRVILMLLLMVCTVAAGAGAVPISPQPQPAPAAPDATPASPAAPPAADAAKPKAEEAKADQVTLSSGPMGVGGFLSDVLNKKRGIILQSIQNIADAIDERLAQANKVFYQGSAGFIVIFVAVYILYQAGKMLFPFFPLDRVSTALNASLTRILLAVVVTMFTASAMGPWKNFIAPVMVSGINYASELLFTAVCTIKTSTPSGKTVPIAIEGVTCNADKATVAADREPRLFNTADPKTIGKSIERLFGWIEQSILTMVGGAIKAMLFGPNGQLGVEDLLQGSMFMVVVLMCLALAITGLIPYFTLGMRFVFFLFGGMILAIMVYFAAIALVIPAFTSFVGFWLRATLKLAVEIVMIAFAIAISLATMNEALVGFQKASEGQFLAPIHDVFITLWGIFFIMNMLVQSAKTLAGAITAGGGQGLDLDAGAEMAEKVQQEAEKMIQQSQEKGREGLHFAYSK
jgi:hypothetical protein